MDGRGGLAGEQNTPPRTDGVAGEPEALVAVEVLRRLRTELLRNDAVRLSEPAVAIIGEACADARRRGVKPERLIVALKEEIRSATPNDGFRRRELLDEGVRRCIRMFFTADTSS